MSTLPDSSLCDIDICLAIKFFPALLMVLPSKIFYLQCDLFLKGSIFPTC